jgi:hypothetical protein
MDVEKKDWTRFPESSDCSAIEDVLRLSLRRCEKIDFFRRARGDIGRLAGKRPVKG